MSPDDSTDVMPGGGDDPTRVNPAGDEPTRVNPPGDESTRVNPSGEEPTRVTPPGDRDDPRSAAGNGRRGIGVLLAAIVASVVLAGSYLAFGGPVGPDSAADPCDPRPWTDPGNVEEAAQQFALSAADGAACKLGVSREELTRSIADDNARQVFMDEHGFSDADLEEALRAGLNRAVDDAENAGALGGIPAVGIRLLIKVMPMSTMIDLLENADSVFNGNLESLGSAGDAIDAITGGLESGSSEDPLGGVRDAIEGVLPEGTTDDIDQLIPEETQRQLEGQAKEKLRQGLNDLLGP